MHLKLVPLLEMVNFRRSPMETTFALVILALLVLLAPLQSPTGLRAVPVRTRRRYPQN